MSEGIKKTRINRDITYDPNLFKGYLTKTLFDRLLSSVGGVHKGMNYLEVGDPGVGKTTITLDALSNISVYYPDAKLVYISGEMTITNFYSYIQRYPKFGDIDMVFTQDYVPEFVPGAKGVYKMFCDLLDEGQDIVVLDSLEMLKMALKEELDISGNQAEKQIIRLCKEHNEGKNKRKVNTAFILIQHVTKGGTFVGSNALMHLVDASLQIRYDELFGTDERYIYFDKHRFGTVGDKLYFTLKTEKDVQYNEKRFNTDQQQKQLRHIEANRISKQDEEFDEAFGTLTPVELTEQKLAEDGSHVA